MHFAVVLSDIPNLSGGDRQTGWVIVESMIASGQRVTTCIAQDSTYDWESEEKRNQMDSFRQLGTDVVTFRYTPRVQDRYTLTNPADIFHRMFRPPLDLIFPTIQIATKVNEFLGQLRPDAVLALYFGGVAATHGLSGIPRMAALGELPHVLYSLWSKLAPKRPIYPHVKQRVITYLDRFNFKRMELELLKSCQSTADFSISHVAELRRIGLSSCMDLVNPGYDFGGSDWRRRRKAFDSGRSKFKILMLGGMGAIPTRFGLHLFVDEILPALEDKLGFEKIEIHLAGGGNLPPNLVQKLDSPMVKIRGWVESAADEYLSADVVLVPNPVPLGLITRIFHALSCGACVIAHEANITEAFDMVADKNILIGRNGAEIAEAIVRAFEDPALRERIGTNGRSTFEKCYSGEATVPRIVQEMERIALERSK